MGVRSMLGMACTVVALATPAVPAAATTVPPTSIEIHYGVAPDGGGTLGATTSPPAGVPVSWTSCAGGGPACLPYPSQPGGMVALNAGDSPVGTVFEASATVNDIVLTARSRPYQGRVRWTEPPGIVGRIRANGFVRPVPAKWAGGWGVERSYPQLQVCTGQRARRCLTLSDANYWDRCPGTGAVIPKRYAGWYLRAVDRRAGPSVPLLAIAYGAPEAIPPARIDGKTTMVTPAVRIGRATRPPKRRCGKGKRLAPDQLREMLRRNAELKRMVERRGR